MPLTIKQRSRGGNFYLRGSIAGVSVRESTGTNDRRAAEAIRVRREAEILERVALGRSAGRTFAEAALTYLETGGEARFLGPLLEYFGPDRRLAEIDNAAVNAAAAALYPGAAASTINRQVITPIAAIENLAAEDDMRAARRFRRRRVSDARLRWLTPAEAERLLTEAEPRMRPLIAFLLGTGARAGEALALQRADLHLDTRQAFLARAEGRQTKNGFPRMVRYPARVARLLAASGLPDAGAVFRTPKGAAYKLRDAGGGQIQAAFNKARDAAKLGADVTPHTCRHTWATWFDAATGDFGQLLDLGGWRSVSTAQRYRKIAPDSLAADLAAHGWAFGRDRPEAEAAPETSSPRMRPRRA
ncbi:Site-specific recombinase XerD [Albimonas donghaensis]|uniref:Site-specific recombinase XerD n=2 Tax=Albimonas donghaensis TaxID=356660 RepID=A0A1H3FEJ9_9RHOB|nr:Site-specific recombinase XerD [Albimonas donghaensis]